MASLKCSSCGGGIHYHGMPEGIEYIFFKFSDWEYLTKIKCPADRIELDYDGKYITAWRCPACGTFEFFDDEHHTHVTHVYELETGEPHAIESGREMDFGLFFDDYLWDEIAESSTPMNEIRDKYSGYFWIKKDDEAMLIFEDKEMKNCIAHYKRIEIAKE